MARARKDNRGRVLRKGEVQRSSDKLYMYTYTDPLGRRKYIYAKDLVQLREKEKQLVKDQLDGLDTYVAGQATVNQTFDRYISTKTDLRESTKSNYIYMYDKFVRDSFGKLKIADIKYSDVLCYYQYLLGECELSYSVVDSIHCLLHPTFQMAVRDEIIRKNPSDGVKREVAKKMGKNKGIRHALKEEEQAAFMDYVAKSPVYCRWWPLFTVLLGTGCRIGEVVALRWEDIDYERRTISVNHNLVSYQDPENGGMVLKINLPKTEAGIRTIPMLDAVKQAFEMEYEDQLETGFNEQVIDGMSGFVFKNRFGNVLQPGGINRTIKRIVSTYNNEEIVQAKKEGRDPLILPEFSCHILRHTFATRLCEVESNLKIIQEIMGHRNIETTMDIYAEATERGKQATFTELSAKLDAMF